MWISGCSFACASASCQCVLLSMASAVQGRVQEQTAGMVNDLFHCPSGLSVACRGSCFDFACVVLELFDASRSSKHNTRTSHNQPFGPVMQRSGMERARLLTCATHMSWPSSMLSLLLTPFTHTITLLYPLCLNVSLCGVVLWFFGYLVNSSID